MSRPRSRRPVRHRRRSARSSLSWTRSRAGLTLESEWDIQVATVGLTPLAPKIPNTSDEPRTRVMQSAPSAAVAWRRPWSRGHGRGRDAGSRSPMSRLPAELILSPRPFRYLRPTRPVGFSGDSAAHTEGGRPRMATWCFLISGAEPSGHCTPCPGPICLRRQRPAGRGKRVRRLLAAQPQKMQNGSAASSATRAPPRVGPRMARRQRPCSGARRDYGRASRASKWMWPRRTGAVQWVGGSIRVRLPESTARGTRRW
jgi:hypothetical protein